MTEMFTYLFEVSTCIIVLFAIYYFLLRQLPSFQWNRVYLLLIYVIGFTVPLLSLNVYPLYIQVENLVNTNAANPPAVTNVISESSLSLLDYMLFGYLLIVGLLVLRLLYNLSMTIYTINKADKEKRTNYTLAKSLSDYKVYSFFNYLIVPAQQELQEEIIDHEIVHIRQYHSVDLIIAELVKAILWFNPFVYLMQKAMRINHEYICDSFASGRTGRYNYAQLLADVTFRENQNLLVNNFAYKLKDRIIMLQKIDELKHKKWRYVLIIPMMIIVMHIFAFETYVVNEPLNKSNIVAVDTIPQIEPIYRIDTTTIFDSDTYEARTTVVRHIVADSITLMDSDTKKEFVSVVPRTDDCYVFLLGNRAFGASSSTEVSISELANLLNKDNLKIASIEKECDKVSSWSGRVIFVSRNNDPQAKDLTMKNNKIGKVPQRHIAVGTKIFFENFIVNDIELAGFVLIVK